MVAMMSPRKTYQVTVTREAGAWLADVPELRGAHTYARNLRSLDRYVREVIVLAADLPDGAEDTFDLDWTFDTGDEDTNQITAELRTRRAEIDQAAQELAERTAEVARLLVARGWSVRDVAALLDVSPQRVSQVTAQQHTPGMKAATGKRTAEKDVTVQRSTADRRAVTTRRRAGARDRTGRRHAS